MKNIYLDVETTGLNAKTCAITQFAAIIEIDGKTVEEINWKIKPDINQAIYREALEVTNKSFNDILEYDLSQQEFYNKLIAKLDNYINKYDKKDKFYLLGYNSHSFDEQFLRTLFTKNGNNFYNSYFHYPSIDVMIIAAYKAIGQREKLHNFKLITVAESLGIKVEEEKVHDAMYDVNLTREIFKIIQADE